MDIWAHVLRSVLAACALAGALRSAEAGGPIPPRYDDVLPEVITVCVVPTPPYVMTQASPLRASAPRTSPLHATL